jgi:hypothetical protein
VVPELRVVERDEPGLAAELCAVTGSEAAPRSSGVSGAAVGPRLVVTMPAPLMASSWTSSHTSTGPALRGCCEVCSRLRCRMIHTLVKLATLL